MALLEDLILKKKIYDEDFNRRGIFRLSTSKNTYYGRIRGDHHHHHPSKIEDEDATPDPLHDEIVYLGKRGDNTV